MSTTTTPAAAAATFNDNNNNNTKPFPTQHLIPKGDTGVTEFSGDNKKYGSNNGTHCRVGILDTGIDPNAAGLQFMSDGVTRKLVHAVDCTGSGDVDCSFEAVATSSTTRTIISSTSSSVSSDNNSSRSSSATNCYYQVTGLSGYVLQLPAKWTLKAFPVAVADQKTNNNEEKKSDGAVAAAANEKANDNTTATANVPKDDIDTNANNTCDVSSNKSTTTTTEVQVRLGIKRAYELYPSKLKTRLQQERLKVLQEKLSPVSAAVRAALTELQAISKPTPAQKLQIVEQQERLKILQQLPDDPGPLYDLVVFWDGTHYRVALYLQGRLMTPVPLTDFDQEYQFVNMCTASQINVAVNFYNQGKTVSLVTDASPHGTHVAGICASADPSQSSRQGVAPGAELVSLKIGDSRLGSMETGAALTRALQQAIRLKCDVVNLSYGEGCQVPNTGRFVELLEEMVYKHNIIFVSSAGNNGPALSTVGTPGGTSTATIGVAAHVSPDSMKANYSMKVDLRTIDKKNDDDNIAASKNNDNAASDDGNDITTTTSSDTTPTNNTKEEMEPHMGTTYTWSSVGPTADGCIGVNVTAPGGAITSVSNWCLQRSMLMNGTSMSSPHAAGCVALLVSACKSRNIPISPARIKRALQNTSCHLPGLLSVQQGSGMIQVPAAMAYLEKFARAKAEDMFFTTSIDNRENARGIYLRDPVDSVTKNSFVVRIDPIFPRQDVATEAMQRQKIEFEMGFALQVTTNANINAYTKSAAWVSVPDHFILMNQGRTFKVDVDPTDLDPGVHEAFVHGLDTENFDRGPLFTVPITVVKPFPVDRLISLGKLSFQPAEVKRFFVVPPAGATWMDVTVRDWREATAAGEVDSSTKLFVLHTVQLLPHAAYRDFEKQKYLNFRPGQVNVTSIAVEESITCEVDLARYWSTMGASSLELSIEFRGIRPVPNRVHMLCGARGEMVRFYSDLVDEFVCPKVTLNKWLTPVRPKADPVLSPLSEHDQLPSLCKDVHQLILEYEFDQDEKGSFVPRMFGLQGVLYESAFESQLLLIFDGEKKYLGAADAWPSEITASKGKVVVRAQIRHDDPSMLEKLKDMPLWVERSLEKEISLSVYPSREAVMKGNGTFKRRLLRKGSGAAAFVAEPAPSKIPSCCKTGDILQGSMTFASVDASLPGDGKRPGGFPFSLSIGPKPKKPSSESDSPELEDTRTVEEKMNEAVRDAKIAELGKLSQKEKDDGRFEEFYAKLEAEYIDFLPLRMLILKHLDTHKDRLKKLDEIINAGATVLGLISEDELALHFGRKIDSDNAVAVKVCVYAVFTCFEDGSARLLTDSFLFCAQEREKMKEKKVSLIETYVRMAMAYDDMKTDDSKTKFDDTIKRLKAWADIDGSDKYAALVIQRETREERYGNALKVVNKLLSKDGTKDDAIKPISRSDLYEKKVELLEKLGYSVLVEYEKTNHVIACPKSYALF